MEETPVRFLGSFHNSMTVDLKQRYTSALDEWQSRFMITGQAMPVLKERTVTVDSVVQEAYAATVGTSAAEGTALLAVGGYGRRELFPYSDVDLMVLVRRAPDQAVFKDALSDFLRNLWDAGLRVSQSVRTVEECCQVPNGNFEMIVSLLDERLLAGDRTLYALFRERFGKFIQAERRDLTRRLCRMTRSRHAHFHETIYRLEPDVKESPGGLRDFHAMRWLRILRGEDPAAFDDPRPIEFLFSTRCFLHFQAGRDQNTLNFEMQDMIAATAFSPWQEPATWMRAWFRNAHGVYRTVLAELEAAESQDRSLIANFRDWRSRLSNSDFTVSRDLLFFRNPNDLESDSALPLRLFQFVARHGVRPSRATEQRIVTHLLRFSQVFRQDPPPASYWKDLMSLPHVALALRTMAATGFLGAVLPEWERIEHLVVRDFYHQYTVDEHTMVAIEVLDDVTRGDNPEAKRMAELAAESSGDMWLLKLAMLLHDIGKGSGRDHTLESIDLTRGFIARSKLAPEHAETVLFLIDRHLALNATLQGRDLQDPATAKSVAEQVKTVERLRLLTLLSYADVSAVNNSAMTPWRLEQLWRLYRMVHRELVGGLSNDRVETAEQAYGDVSVPLAEFLDGLPQRYLWTHNREQAAAHCNLFQQARQTGSAVAVERREGAFRADIVTNDRPFLLASLAGALSSFGLNILKAELFSNSSQYAVDSFVFTDPTHGLDLNPPEVERLRSVLKRVATGDLRVEDLLKSRVWKARPALLAGFTTRVSVDADSSATATVFEVITQDRPGLLYSLATAISRHGGNIDVLIAGTEAHKAIDVFHVTRDGRKLTPEECEVTRAALYDACQPG